MIVMKFGGSSLATPEGLRQAGELIARSPQSDSAKAPCVVLSAMGDATDRLLAITGLAKNGRLDDANDAVSALFAASKEITQALLTDATLCLAELADLQRDIELLVRGIAKPRAEATAELYARATDALIAHGERIATTVLAAHMNERGTETQVVDARDVICTDNTYGKARPNRGAILQRAHQNIGPHVARGTTVLTQGFVGSAPDRTTTTLGRGGSDWSAALLGAALRANELQIWTDVEGVLTADPRVVADAAPIEHLTPDEAAELAAFGASVLHPSTIQPVVDKDIPVTVRHTMRPEGRFTRIDRQEPLPPSGIAALASRGPVTVLTMTSRRMLDASGYLARLFEAFGELDVSVDLVTTAEVSVACTVEADAPVARLIAALDGLAHVEVLEECAIVAAIGDGLQNTDSVLERACRALHPIRPEMVSFGGNSRNLSFVVRRSDQDKAMQQLHAEFFSATSPTTDVQEGQGNKEHGR